MLVPVKLEDWKMAEAPLAPACQMCFAIISDLFAPAVGSSDLHNRENSRALGMLKTPLTEYW